MFNDDFVPKIKNKEPVKKENDRARILQALKCVDQAVVIDIETTNDKMLALEKFGFDVLFSGDDWRGTERYNKTEKQFAPLGVSIEYLPYTQGVSSSDIKNKLKK
ncbi:MAG: glycerol-3-phosphate cytidylyltransferase [bacterium]|nr:glycerol-3-phosphate cytidylyltransferase [bacterium]